MQAWQLWSNRLAGAVAAGQVDYQGSVTGLWLWFRRDRPQQSELRIGNRSDVHRRELNSTSMNE